jgi:transposase
MKAYSIDLRQRIVLAVESGDGSQAEIAEQYGVSLSFVERLLRRWRTSESVTPLSGKPGPKRTLEPYGAWLRAEVKRQPDATLAELCERLAQTHGVQVHPSQMWRELLLLDLPLKKVAARQRT